MHRGLRTHIALAIIASAVTAFVPHGDAAAQSPGDPVSVDSLPKTTKKTPAKRPKKPKKPTKINPPPETVEPPPPVVAPAVEAKPVETKPVEPVPAPPTTPSSPVATAAVAPEATTAAVEATPSEKKGGTPAEGKVAYHFGARYRLGLLPQPLLSVFARGGSTYLFHFLGVELDARWKGFSVTPALAYADLTTKGDAFGDKSHSGPGYVSYVRSDLRAILATVDIAWTFPLSHAVDAEIGAGIGVGVPFGNLINNWVYQTADGPLVLGNNRYAACKTVNDGIGCRPQDHAAPTPIRINGYIEKGWAGGGSSPTVIPWLAIPQAALRFRLSRAYAMRVGVGFATTGFWVGLGVTRALSSSQHDH